jgi:hypothetical protein
MNDTLEHRSQWFKKYAQRLEEGTIEPPLPGVRYTCPCCGYLTLSQRGSFEICELCRWEDDGQDDPHADEVWGGPNGRYSLSEARQNFKDYLIKYSPNDPKRRLGGNTNSSLEEQAKRAIITAFESMIDVSDEVTIGTLWQRIFENEAILRSEVRRRVHEFEAQAKKNDSQGQS